MTAKVSIIKTERKVIVAKFSYGTKSRVWNYDTEKYDITPYQGEVRLNLSGKSEGTLSLRFPRERTTVKLVATDLRAIEEAMAEVRKAYLKLNS